MSRIVTLTMNPALDVSTSTAAVRPTDKLRCTQPLFEPGGGGINVARVLGELGGDATAIFPSGGPTGASLQQLLVDSGVRSIPIAIAQATRESFTVDEQESGEQFRFVLPGPAMSDTEKAACLGALADFDPAPAFVVASGSLPPGVSADFYSRVANICTQVGARLLLDTSGEPLRSAGGCSPIFLIKPNLREAEALLGRDLRGDAAENDAARELVDGGRFENVIISLGERGALLADQQGVERFAAIPVTPKSAVGAGDSMVAGIVLGLDRGLRVRDAVHLGLAAGAAALLTPGSGLARRADVERLFEGRFPL
jgi:6-phosphofructokinase 2